LPLPVIAIFGAVLIVGHNALDNVDPATFGRFAPLWEILHQPGNIIRTDHALVRVSYVLIPWVGVTALGYVLGACYRWDAPARRRLLVWLGTGCIVAFVALRYSNLYGDFVHWRFHDTALFTVMSFIDTSKYPPSLLFLLMTLGPTLLLLRAFDGGVPSLFRPALVFGKVPLFFYIVHFYVIHLLVVAVSYARYGVVSETFQSPDLAHFPFSAPPGWDAGLPAIYAIWIGVVVALYPLCKWYAGVRRRSGAWWLSYL